MKKSTIIKIMEDAAYKAGKSLVRDFGEVENLQVSLKGPGDFVTAADKRAEKTLMEELLKVRPGFGFLIEESGEIKGSDNEYRWIIDPLDGTTNFMHGIPMFCISIGLEKTDAKGAKEIIAGLIYAPVLNEVFWAEKNEGAFNNNSRLKVSNRSQLSFAMASSGLLRNKPFVEKHDLVIRALLDAGVSVRMLGSSALDLAYVAAGRLDCFWYPHLKPWDLAAGSLIVREAKGVVRDLSGGQNYLSSGALIATNDALYSKFEAIIVGKYQ